ncbi:MAG: cysteine hydrolase [Chloroflexi bacterium]|nr:cysteine hydrolase [Chloroflexota bacterium]
MLVMDCQRSILEALTPVDRERVLQNVSRALQAARAANMAVFYVVVQFRDGYAEVAPRNTLFSQVKQNGALRQSQDNAQVCPEVAPLPGEPVVIKKRIGAFTGSDLEVLLRSRGIDTLVLTGVSTLGVIESTARQAFDMDYRVFVLGDCCADRNPEDSALALARFLPRISTVCPVDEFIAGIA